MLGSSSEMLYVFIYESEVLHRTSLSCGSRHWTLSMQTWCIREAIRMPRIFLGLRRRWYWAWFGQLLPLSPNPITYRNLSVHKTLGLTGLICFPISACIIPLTISSCLIYFYRGSQPNYIAMDLVVVAYPPLLFPSLPSPSCDNSCSFPGIGVGSEHP